VAKNSGSVSALAERYAQSLYELAFANNLQKQVAESFCDFNKLIESSSDLKAFIASPLVSREEQAGVLEALLPKANVTGLVANFVMTVAKNGRLAAIQPIMSAYGAIYSRAQGEVLAEVTSAAALTTAQVESLTGSLKEKLGKTPVLTQKIDPRILGGLIIKVGSQMLDSSLKTHLNSLKIAMKEVG
jgi:F-type H+-transporting ATPase subunit delta